MAPVRRSQLSGQSLGYDRGKTISEMRAGGAARSPSYIYQTHIVLFCVSNLNSSGRLVVQVWETTAVPFAF